MKGDIVEKKGLWRVVSSNMLNRMELRMFEIPNGILVWWTMHTQSQAMLHSLKHGPSAVVWSMQVIMFIHMTQERLTTCIMRLAAITGTMQLARFSAARLRPAVLFKDVCSSGHPMTSNMRCFFHFHICDICVYICVYTPLVGIMSTAQSRAWSCHPCYETNGCFIFRECQCVLLGTAWIDWTRPNDTNTTFQVSTPLITWCLTVYSMSDFLLLFFSKCVLLLLNLLLLQVVMVVSGSGPHFS